MKTLRESLFDTDLENKDVLLGDLYKFSDIMKSLNTYLEELATPTNTMGMGNPGEIAPGMLSEPVMTVTAKAICQNEKKKKKKKQLKESLFDKDLSDKKLTFDGYYQLEVVHMQSPYAFNGLYEKKIINNAKYRKYLNGEGLNKYWSYYGTNPDWKNIPENIENICKIFIGVINDVDMAEVNKNSKDDNRRPNMWTLRSGSTDSLAKEIRKNVSLITAQYSKGTITHNVYVDTDYRYKKKDGYIQIKIGKDNWKKGFPDYLELIYKKK